MPSLTPQILTIQQVEMSVTRSCGHERRRCRARDVDQHGVARAEVRPGPIHLQPSLWKIEVVLIAVNRSHPRHAQQLLAVEVSRRRIGGSAGDCKDAVSVRCHAAGGIDAFARSSSGPSVGSGRARDVDGEYPSAVVAAISGMAAVGYIENAVDE